MITIDVKKSNIENAGINADDPKKLQVWYIVVAGLCLVAALSGIWLWVAGSVSAVVVLSIALGVGCKGVLVKTSSKVANAWAAGSLWTAYVFVLLLTAGVIG